MTTIKIQPEFHDLIPPPSHEEETALFESIKRDGIRDAVTLWEETRVLLDGHTRVKIHRELGCLDGAIPTVCLSFPDADAAKAWMITNQFARRNISSAQREILAAKLATLKQGARTDLSPNGGMSQADAAKKFGVSKRQVERAAKVIKDGIPEVAAAVTRGEMSVSAAAHAVEVLDEDDQRAVMALPVEARKEAIADLSTPAGSQTPEQIEKAVRRVVDPVFAMADAIKSDSCLLPMTTACLLSTGYFQKAFSDTVMKTLSLEGCDKITHEINKLQDLIQSCFEKVRSFKSSLKKKGA